MGLPVSKGQEPWIENTSARQQERKPACQAQYCTTLDSTVPPAPCPHKLAAGYLSELPDARPRWACQVLHRPLKAARRLQPHMRHGRHARKRIAHWPLLRQLPRPQPCCFVPVPHRLTGVIRRLPAELRRALLPGCCWPRCRPSRGAAALLPQLLFVLFPALRTSEPPTLSAKEARPSYGMAEPPTAIIVQAKGSQGLQPSQHRAVATHRSSGRLSCALPP